MPDRSPVPVKRRPALSSLTRAAIVGIVSLLAVAAFTSSAVAGVPTYSKSVFVTEPWSVATNAQGDTYVASSGRVIRFSKEGVWKEAYGNETWGYGPGFVNRPRGVAVDTFGDVWAADTLNYKVIEWTGLSTYREIAPTTAVAVASDKLSNTWVLDEGNEPKKYSREGKYLATLVPHDFYGGTGISVDGLGHIWVAAKSTLTNGWTMYEDDSAGKTLLASFALPAKPAGVAGDAAGNVWVAFPTLCRVEKFSPAGKLLEQFGECGTGTGKLTGMSTFAGLAIGPEGALWIAMGNRNEAQKWVPTP